MKVIIYANYGVLAHEYTPIYTVGAPITEAYDELAVEVPGAEVGEDCMGFEHLWVHVPTWDKALRLDEVLATGRDNNPIIAFGTYSQRLKVLDKAD